VDDAKRRCAQARYPNRDPGKAADRQFQTFLNEIEARTIIYVRDGFSYEVKELVKTATSSALTFECMPSEEAYKVGAFVVTLPFEEITRVEIYAVHAKEKPEDMPSIRGFGGSQPPPLIKKGEAQPVRQEAAE